MDPDPTETAVVASPIVHHLDQEYTEIQSSIREMLPDREGLNMVQCVYIVLHLAQIYKQETSQMPLSVDDLADLVRCSRQQLIVTVLVIGPIQSTPYLDVSGSLCIVERVLEQVINSDMCRMYEVGDRDPNLTCNGRQRPAVFSASGLAKNDFSRMRRLPSSRNIAGSKGEDYAAAVRSQRVVPSSELNTHSLNGVVYSFVNIGS